MEEWDLVYRTLPSLVDKTFKWSPIAQDYLAFTVNRELLPSTLSCLEECRSLRTPLSKKKALDVDRADGPSGVDHIMFFFMFLLRERQDLLPTLLKFYNQFKVWSLEVLLEIERPLWELIPIGSIVFCEPSQPALSINARDFLTYYWAIGKHDIIVGQYVADVHAPAVCRDVILATLSASPAYCREGLSTILASVSYNLNMTPIDPRFQTLVRRIPWWKIKIQHRRLDRRSNLRIPHCTLRRGNFLLDDILLWSEPSLPLDIVNLKNHLLDSALKEIGKQSRWPLFNPRDLKHYPRSFVPTARAFLLCWKRLGLNRDVGRNIMLNYILWNCFDEETQKVRKVEQYQQEEQLGSNWEYAKLMLAEGYFPDVEAFRHRQFTATFQEYYLFKGGLLGFEYDREVYCQRIREYFYLRCLDGKSWPDLEDPEFPTHIRLKLQRGTMELQFHPRQSKANCEYLQKLLEYLDRDDPQGFTKTHLVSWMACGSEHLCFRAR